MALESPPARRGRFFDDRSGYVDRFGWLLMVTAVTVVLLSLVDLADIDTDAAPWFAAVATGLVAATLSLALRAAGMARRWQRIVDTVLVVGFGGITVLSLVSAGGADRAPVIAPGATVLLSALAPVVVVRRLLRHRTVTRSTLLGAISAYLLIALAFFYAFLIVEQWRPESFFGAAEPTTSFCLLYTSDAADDDYTV